MPPVINSDLCLKCGSCVDVCPMDVFYGSKRGKFPLSRILKNVGMPKPVPCTVRQTP